MIDGGKGEDHLEGGHGKDVIHGGDDYDFIEGGEGDDTLHGDAGNDSLYGGSGNDTILGGEGNDRLGGNAGDDTLDGGDGDDRLSGGYGNDVLNGGAGNDELSDAFGDANILNGGEGDDDLLGEGVLNGGTGDDILRGRGELNGGDGADVLTLHGNDGTGSSVSGQVHTFDGGAGDDLLILTPDDLPRDSIVAHGGTGADTFVLDYNGAPHVPEIRDFDPAEDTLFIDTPRAVTDPDAVRIEDWQDGSGADVYVGDTLVAKVTGATGLDPSAVVLGHPDLPDNETKIGTDGDDTLFGLGGHDTLDGGNGDDRLSGGAGDDLLDGGAGNDTLYGDEGQDILRGGEGDDHLISRGDGASLLDGGEGNDKLFATGEGSVLDGGEGDDWLSGRNGLVMTGGAGADTFDVHFADPGMGPVEITDFNPAEDVLEFTDAWSVRGQGPISTQVEVVDWANGEGADVYLSGILMAKVTGAAGLDPAAVRLDLDISGDNPTPVAGGDQDDDLRTSTWSDNVVDGGAGNDTIEGTGHLIGGEGNDTITGAGHLEGGTGNDTLKLGVMSDEDDTADGGAGDDMLFASTGTLTGGAGADTFTLYAKSNSTAPITITDFDPAEDQLEIRDLLRDDMDAELRVVDWPDGTGADIYLGDLQVAAVTGAAGMAPGDIALSR